MKLTPVNYFEVNQKAYAKTKNLAAIEEFQAMDAACVCIEDHGYKSATHAAAALNNSAKRFNRQRIKAFTRGDKVYLVNTTKIEQLNMREGEE